MMSPETADPSGADGRPPTNERPRIVVGVDASTESEDALRWAARYAEMVSGSLDVVHAWELKNELAWLEPVPPPVNPTEIAREAMSAMLYRVLGPDWSSKGTMAIIEGHPAKVLVNRARGAALLVLGSRGLGGFDGLLIGSVSGTCAMHATCSVIIVREPANEE